MSRFKRFAHSLTSSYALTGVNVVYTLISMPLAFRYLTQAEFGLWALTLQIAGYISLVDLGMSSSVARILIDHKDERANGRYGGVIKSGFLVGLAQGAIALVAGLGLVWFLGGWLKVPVDLSRQFLWLMIGQVLLTAVTFASRLFGQILFAWQRLDVWNYSQMFQLAAGLAALWAGFVLGFGVFSLLAGAAVSWVCGLIANVLSCHRLGFLPKAGEWGRASREQFRELFSYGADLFLITIGAQLIMSSQTVLVSRQLGMEAAALWSVMTKAFTVVSQVVFRVIGNAMPAFAEMYVRKENERLWSRYRAMFVTVSVLSGVCGVLFAACNGPFVSVWMHGQFSWPAINNVLLAAWLMASVEQCCHNSLILFLKEIRGLKYVFLVEGVAFVGVSAAILPSTGLTGMLVCSLAATVFCTWAVGTWRVAQLLGGRLKPMLWDWHLPLFYVLAAMVPCWLAAEWMLSNAPDWLRLGINGALLAIVGACVSIRFALPHSLTAELVDRLPGPMRRAAWVVTRSICGRSFRQA